MDLAEFLLARIADDEAAARNAPGPEWIRGIERDGSPGHWRGVEAQIVALPARDPSDSLSIGNELLRAKTGNDSRRAFWAVDHAARWDPARVLAECEAKRRIAALASGEARSAAAIDEGFGDLNGCLYDTANAMRDVLQLLAVPYASHEDYRPEWAPTVAV